jgi:hypothetical protein
VIICEESFLFGEKEYDSKYPLELIKWMANGYAVSSFLGSKGLDAKTWERWTNQFEDLKKAIEIGECISLGHFEKLAKMQAVGVIKGNQAMLWNLMKNRHPDYFKDKIEHEHKGDMTFLIDTGISRNSEDVLNEDYRETPIKGKVLETPDHDLSSLI